MHVHDLGDYITQEKGTEKVLFEDGLNFVCDDYVSRRAEMMALAETSKRSKNPVNHYMMSWKEGEQPTPKQAERAVKILLKELGLSEHQALYGLHKDTHNIHLHVAVNRVHPHTEKVVNLGLDIEAAHRAVAKIEREQGWQRETHGRYKVVETGKVVHSYAGPDITDTLEPGQRCRDMEHRTGEKSAERIGIERAAQILRNAMSWAEIHRQLAAMGMRYEKKGSGAVLWVWRVAVKASSVDRKASLSSMQKRLGEYKPALPATHELAKRTRIAPEPIKKDAPAWAEYIAERKSYYARKESAKLNQQNEHEQERNKLLKEQRAKRLQLMQGKWRNKGEALNALRSVVAAQQASEKAELQERHQRQRAFRRQSFPRFLDYEEWLRIKLDPELAGKWRYRASDQEPQLIEGNRDEIPKARDIRNFKPEIRDGHVYYFRENKQDVSFIDRWRSIEVYDWRNRDSTLAAMQLAAQKWGNFTLTGTDEYKSICVRLAAEHGFKVANSELQESIQKERQRIKQERAQAAKSEQLKEFERYHAAVGAERYRVTSIRMDPDGRKLTFVLDKHDGVTKGFTPEEIAKRTPEMQHLQSRGENLYYTPLSENKHHILIDDMDRKKLERLIKDGYKPAVVLESSPGNYQAVITVAKLGTEYDRDVGNRLAERLNREYGDPKLSGCVHPHRAPGYENRKPLRRLEDGTYPEVRLLKAECRECERTWKLSRAIDDECRQLRVNKSPRLEAKKQDMDMALRGPAGSAVDVYGQHYRDVMSRQRGDVNLSRVDSMIAIRMRVTGHSQIEIKEVLRECAPRIREPEKHKEHNWNDYAERTAAYAFGPKGNSQVAELGRYQHRWRLLEETTLNAEKAQRISLEKALEKEREQQERKRQRPERDLDRYRGR